MPHWEKITGEYEVVSGFLCGILVLGGLLVWTVPGIYWPIAGPVLLIFGVLMLLDDAFPYGRQPHLMSEAGGFIAGFLAVISSSILGLILWLLAPSVLLSVVKLTIRLLRKMQKERPKTFKP